MPSLIQPYEYDIFISYRHNDNRSGWVTDFVRSLQEELAATIKEPVSVYFDSNPVDGLLESHNVNKSLQGKLKCLIFIPIISQTYCDPKSFAWKHEFCAFNKLTEEDQFGRDIKLSNKNVGNRILPVKIHDLDPADNALLEIELGGVLRAIDFIYKEPGVNRPLKSSDNKNDNQNKTDYRNQVNKVANAIKDIISSLKNSPSSAQPTLQNKVTDYDRPVRNKQFSFTRTKMLMASLLLVVLATAGYFLYSKVFTSKQKAEVMDKSIAVLPFDNLSKEPGREYFSDGMTEEIINQLAKVKALRVTSRTSSMRYRNSKLSLKEIAHELGVTKILEGTVRTDGNQMRISVQLINAQADKHLFSETFDYTLDVKSIFAIQKEIALLVAERLQASLSPKEEKTLTQIPTLSLEAYQLYLRAKQVVQDRKQKSVEQSISLLHKALELDPDFILAKSQLADSYYLNHVYHYPNSSEHYEIAYKLAKEVIAIDPDISLAYSILAAIEGERGNFNEFRLNLNKAVEDDPTDAEVLQRSAGLFTLLGENQKAILLAEKAMRIDPFSQIVNYNYLMALLSGREFVRAKMEVQEIIPRLEGKLRLNALENLHYFTGNCDSLKDSNSKLECFVSRGNIQRAKEEFAKMNYFDSGDDLIRKQIEKALVYQDADLMFESLHQASESKTMRFFLCVVRSDPAFDQYRNEPRYHSLMKEVGLED